LLAPCGRGVSADPASDQTPPPTIRPAALVTMAASRRGRVPGGPPSFVLDPGREHSLPRRSCKRSRTSPLTPVADRERRPGEARFSFNLLGSSRFSQCNNAERGTYAYVAPMLGVRGISHLHRPVYHNSVTPYPAPILKGARPSLPRIFWHG